MSEQADQYPGKEVVGGFSLPVGHKQAKCQQCLKSPQYDDVFHTGQSYVVNITFGLTGGDVTGDVTFLYVTYSWVAWPLHVFALSGPGWH